MTNGSNSNYYLQQASYMLLKAIYAETEELKEALNAGKVDLSEYSAKIGTLSSFRTQIEFMIK
jgi:hypothetical protein